jgi:predicted enzyme related to lactoylglutathione lyase
MFSCALFLDSGTQSTEGENIKMMTLYIFRCRARLKLYGATRYETASNLPADRCSGGWEFYERVELADRGSVRFAVDAETLRRQIRKNGWHVWDESPRDLRRGAAVESNPVPREQQRPPAEPETLAPQVSALVTKIAAPATLEKIQAPPVAVTTRPEGATVRSVATLPVRHQVVWFDIPVRDLERALRFYSAVLGTQLKKEQAGPGAAIAVLPHPEGSIGGCLVLNADARPSESGPLLYLNTHSRLDEALHMVENYGGRVLSTRHSIAPFGFRAIVLDSEGNRIALHSM